MRSLPLVLAVAVVVGLSTGCGSSRPSGVHFHSASRHYTATQVEAAFAAQGIQLRLAHEQLPGYVVLHGRTAPHLVTILVELSAGQPVPAGYATGGQSTRDGNVRVSFDPATAQAVKSALARLD